MYPTHRNAQSFCMVTILFTKKCFYITDLVKNESYLPSWSMNSSRYTIYGEVQIYINHLFYQIKTSSYK